MIIHSLYDIDKLLAIRNKPEKKWLHAFSNVKEFTKPRLSGDTYCCYIPWLSLN